MAKPFLDGAVFGGALASVLGGAATFTYGCIVGGERGATLIGLGLLCLAVGGYILHSLSREGRFPFNDTDTVRK